MAETFLQLCPPSHTFSLFLCASLSLTPFSLTPPAILSEPAKRELRCCAAAAVPLFVCHLPLSFLFLEANNKKKKRRKGVAPSLLSVCFPAVMNHKEEFEVVTAPDGTSTLSITLACATVKEHYQRTTTTHSSVASDPAEVCSTGLRVYEGAQVLAAFLCRYGAGLLPPTPEMAAPPTLTRPTSSAVSVVELGCGCGLVSFTLDALLRGCASPPPSPVSLIFTDASADCLRLVRGSGELAGRVVQDLDGFSAAAVAEGESNSAPAVTLSTLRLAWSDAGVSALRGHLPPREGGAAAQLVLGSDLMYYRVDVNALVQTAKQLLSPPSPLTEASDGLVVFAHFMRIADGQRTLASVAREQQRMHIACLALTAFLDEATVRFRGWSGIEVVLLCPAALKPIARSSHNDDADSMQTDVDVIRALLEARAVAWEDAAVGLPSCASYCHTAATQARALSALLQPYPTSAVAGSRCSGVCGDAAEAAELVDEDALLQLLL